MGSDDKTMTKSGNRLSKCGFKKPDFQKKPATKSGNPVCISVKNWNSGALLGNKKTDFRVPLWGEGMIYLE
jgi:hypothetical protein